MNDRPAGSGNTGEREGHGAHGAPQWIVLIDQSRARLLRATRTAHGRTHLEQRDELLEDWAEREGEPDAPPHTTARQPTPANTPVATSSRGGGTDLSGIELERRRRFARKVQSWLQGHRRDSGLAKSADDGVLVFAASDMFGELRKQLPARELEGLDLRQASLATLDTARLLEERSLIEALETRWG